MPNFKGFVHVIRCTNTLNFSINQLQLESLQIKLFECKKKTKNRFEKNAEKKDIQDDSLSLTQKRRPYSCRDKQISARKKVFSFPKQNSTGSN